MPWLRKINPAIDWQKKTVELRKEKKAKNKKKAKKVTEKTEETEGITEKGRGGYNGKINLTNAEEKEFQQRLNETREALPVEIREFAEVFCQRK
jgi:hypothetical protein